MANSGVVVNAGVITSCVTAGNWKAASQPWVWPLFPPNKLVAMGAPPGVGTGRVPAATTAPPLTVGTAHNGFTPVGPLTETPVKHEGLVSELLKLALAVEPTT